MRFSRVWDNYESRRFGSELRSKHSGIEVLLCECWKNDKFIFYTGVRADWEKPRGEFTKDRCPILDLDHNRGDGDWYVFQSSSPLIKELSGNYGITREQRLQLLTGQTITIEVRNGESWLIKPAG